MSFVQRELDRLSVALVATDRDEPRWKELFAAQQALAWALEPGAAESPCRMITGEDSPAGTEDWASSDSFSPPLQAG